MAQETQHPTRAKVDRHPDGTKIYSDSSIYQGMLLRYDIGDMAYVLGTSKGKMSSYDMAASWRLKRRFYPTLELGFAHGQSGNDTTAYRGMGGFFRTGMDLSMLKKHPEQENALVIGLRLGTALQSYDQTQPSVSVDKLFRADCWGEVVAGIQVQVWAGLQMGWMVRYKFLFTKQKSADEMVPYYIPGFGVRDDTALGLSYFIGYKF